MACLALSNLTNADTLHTRTGLKEVFLACWDVIKRRDDVLQSVFRMPSIEYVSAGQIQQPPSID